MGNLGYDTGQEQSLGGQASARAQDAASTAQEKASELQQQGRSKLGEQLDTRSSDAGSQMRSAAHALRQSTSSLRGEGNTTAADMTDQVADRIERLGEYLEQKRGDELVRDIENFARRRPWMVAGAGLLAGFAASRFVKASSEGRSPRPQRSNRSGYRGGYEPLPAAPASQGAGGGWPDRGGGVAPEPLADAPLARDPGDLYGTV